MWAAKLSLILLHICLVAGDVYLQNVRGSNNRLNGQNRNRQNANRLFNSQNNARGGYNVGGMSYYSGSTIQLEWTNQHSCGEKNANCELIVQYMCHDKLRDGTVETTIPENNNKCYKKNCNRDYKFGMHEDLNYYRTCKFTQRNHRLYTSNQNLKGPTARFTRQNNNGNRHGYECPEERDYYPYWRPSPWKDAVIMTNDTTRCDYYKKESQNTKPRFYCKPPRGYFQYILDRDNLDDGKGPKASYLPLTKIECEKFQIPGSWTGEKGVWTKAPAHGIAEPDCIASPRSRDNHLGNGLGGHTNYYNWYVPDEFKSDRYQCALRMRYNISTNDFNAWDTTSRSNAVNNIAYGPDVHEALGLSRVEAERRGYYMTGNPNVNPIKFLSNGQDIGKKFELKLAFNTNQYGRTFQDRSHAFAIMKRPHSIAAHAKIVNLNVRGKRGNIVQTYPATEYDFVPNSLHVVKDTTYIHFQWTGSDRNPRNNAGQGKAQTDRSNICLLGSNKNPNKLVRRNTYGHPTVSYPADLRTGKNFVGASNFTEIMLCTAGTVSGDNKELDEAGPYYNHRELVRCKVKGTWHYMCTRNNNFTNRSQKAKIICEDGKKKDDEMKIVKTAGDPAMLRSSMKYSTA